MKRRQFLKSLLALGVTAALPSVAKQKSLGKRGYIGNCTYHSAEILNDNWMCTIESDPFKDCFVSIDDYAKDYVYAPLETEIETSASFRFMQ